LPENPGPVQWCRASYRLPPARGRFTPAPPPLCCWQAVSHRIRQNRDSSTCTRAQARPLGFGFAVDSGGGSGHNTGLLGGDEGVNCVRMVALLFCGAPEPEPSRRWFAVAQQDVLMEYLCFRPGRFLGHIGAFVCV